MYLVLNNFYSVDQWLFETNSWYEREVLIHSPCHREVHKAMHGEKWVCTGCYEEPPEAIHDVIRLGNPYKGWMDEVPLVKYPQQSGVSFYLGGIIHPSSFYGGTVNIGSDFYLFDFNHAFGHVLDQDIQGSGI